MTRKYIFSGPETPGVPKNSNRQKTTINGGRAFHHQSVARVGSSSGSLPIFQPIDSSGLIPMLPRTKKAWANQVLPSVPKKRSSKKKTHHVLQRKVQWQLPGLQSGIEKSDWLHQERTLFLQSVEPIKGILRENSGSAPKLWCLRQNYYENGDLWTSIGVCQYPPRVRETNYAQREEARLPCSVQLAASFLFRHFGPIGQFIFLFCVVYRSTNIVFVNKIRQQFFVIYIYI